MADPLLSIQGLVSGYGVTEVLRGIDLLVAPGEIVAVLGSNGAGKSTLNRTIQACCGRREDRSALPETPSNAKSRRRSWRAGSSTSPRGEPSSPTSACARILI